MKKSIVSILTLAMVASLAGTAFAAEITQDTAPQEGETNVILNVAPTYTITIPAEIGLDRVNNNGTVTYEKDATVTASAGVRLLEGEKIQVTLDSDFQLKTSDTAIYALPYKVKVGDSTTEIKSGDTVATFVTSTDAPQSDILHFAAENPEFAGDYTDTVTFNIAIVKE